jgi:hypothetical protein
MKSSISCHTPIPLGWDMLDPVNSKDTMTLVVVGAVDLVKS